MARRKITPDTEDNAVDPAELPELTKKQMAFVEGILEGKNGSEAYRSAFDCSRMSRGSIGAAASKLRHHPKIQMFIEAIRTGSIVNAECTLVSHLRELERLKTLCIKAGNMGAAVQAEQLRGKAVGIYVEKYENVTQSDPLKHLEEIAKSSPEYAAQLAKEAGINWKPSPKKQTVH